MTALPTPDDRPADGERYPAEVLRIATELHGVSYVLLGDDGEWIVILGHPTREQIEAFTPALADRLWDDIELAADYDDLDFTWARLLWACPQHGQSRTEGCQWCSWMEPGVWGLDWAVPKGFPADINASKPGYFPVVIWEDGA